MKIKFSLVFFALALLLLLLTGCAAQATVKAEPTALPYSPVTIEPLEISLGDAAKGETVFTTSCAGCHSTEEAVELAGPSLFQAGKRLRFNYIKDSIENPHAAKSNPDSIEYMAEEIGDQLQLDQLHDVIAYIRTLK